jgi:hypothetical protein
VKAIVDSSIRNLPLDIKDIPLARKINGPDVETLKGKSRSLDPQFPRQVNIPRVTSRDQILEMDLMYVDGDVYLVSVSIPMDLAMVNHVAKEKKGPLKSLDKLLKIVKDQLSQ